LKRKLKRFAENLRAASVSGETTCLIRVCSEHSLSGGSWSYRFSPFSRGALIRYGGGKDLHSTLCALVTQSVGRIVRIGHTLSRWPRFAGYPDCHVMHTHAAFVEESAYLHAHSGSRHTPIDHRETSGKQHALRRWRLTSPATVLGLRICAWIVVSRPKRPPPYPWGKGKCRRCHSSNYSLSFAPAVSNFRAAL